MPFLCQNYSFCVALKAPAASALMDCGFSLPLCGFPGCVRGHVLLSFRSSLTHSSISMAVEYVHSFWGPLVEGMWNISILEGSFMLVLERSLEYKLSKYLHPHVRAQG